MAQTWGDQGRAKKAAAQIDGEKDRPRDHDGAEEKRDDLSIRRRRSMRLAEILQRAIDERYRH